MLRKKVLIPAVLLLAALAAVVGVYAAVHSRQNGNFLVLMYHDFCVEPPQSTEQKSLFTTGEKFAADIDALLALGYLPISLEDYYLGKADPEQKYFAITFDDGYQGVFNFAYPVLVEKQVPGAVFFNTGQAWTLGFLHYWQLREFEEAGLLKIYSHLAYHVKATEQTAEDFTSYLDASLRDLRQYLYEYVGVENSLFMAYPYGDYNRQVYDIAVERGIKLQFVQKKLFAADDVLVRVNVPYDADMAKLVKKAPHN